MQMFCQLDHITSAFCVLSFLFRNTSSFLSKYLSLRFGGPESANKVGYTDVIVNEVKQSSEGCRRNNQQKSVANFRHGTTK